MGVLSTIRAAKMIQIQAVYTEGTCPEIREPARGISLRIGISQAPSICIFGFLRTPFVPNQRSERELVSPPAARLRANPVIKGSAPLI
jgi:hypothetical protein